MFDLCMEMFEHVSSMLLLLLFGIRWRPYERDMTTYEYFSVFLFFRKAMLSEVDSHQEDAGHEIDEHLQMFI